MKKVVILFVSFFTLSQANTQKLPDKKRYWQHCDSPINIS